MLRLTELKLPLDHSPDDLTQALLVKLGVPASALMSYSIFRRAVDARKKSQIFLVYSLDVKVKQEAALLKKTPWQKPHRPSTGYQLPFCSRSAKPLTPSANCDWHRPLRFIRRFVVGPNGL